MTVSSDYLHEIFPAAGASGPGLATGGLTITSLNEAKVVRKGWGEERWLVSEDAPFGFKVIHLKAGERTSLQYHEQKEEANLIVRGEGVLRYADRAGEDLAARALAPGDIVHVRPLAVHRIEAATDLTLVEVSTPELDDVIRLSDDFGRGDGRVAAEHEGRD
ncbi:cupin domain-containing protein [Amycolatopsis rubida]|uniref:Cupin domain-containing protein n=1 Tax=Amycolatopsis rubida TaxID=112413 RepID=A0A1I5VED4_9PSEU|nr:MULTISPECIES: cupin domain-containing protein [Amycolatopsis]MYW90028.1 cupin domain-containing protein [Amycolatopsis rubida]NEC55005.1 cupin domain-containing protein [Amycolatopsis rubida]OAP21106.1 Cupin domain protein [Amycolatopsis sp. M39]SFQ05751.1 Mannose-6-phosphate isomerase, cupin superfamily [Amycolatopsis rubida]